MIYTEKFGQVMQGSRVYIKLEAILEGKKLHCMVWRQGLHTDMAIMTSLLDLYSKCSCICKTCHIFGEMPKKDVIVVNIRNSGLYRSRSTQDAVDLILGWSRI